MPECTCHGPAHNKGRNIGHAMWRLPECTHYDERCRPAPYKAPEWVGQMPQHHFRLAYGVAPWGETLYEDITTDIDHIGWVLKRARCTPDRTGTPAGLIVNGVPVRMEAPLPETAGEWSRWVQRAMSAAPSLAPMPASSTDAEPDAE